MQGGVHLLSGLILASFTDRKEFKLGAVVGAILPDADIIIMAFVYLAIGDSASVIHRSLTHSLLFLILLPGIIISMNFIPFVKKKYEYDFLGFGLGLLAGMATHILLDMMYLTGVYFLWPFYNDLIGFPIVPFESFDTSIAIDSLKLKLIQTTDFYTDIAFFFVPMIFLSYKMDLHKKIRLPALIFVAIDFIVTTIFLGLSFRSAISYENHVIQLYYTGTFFLLFSLIAPFLFRNVIREFKFKPWEIAIIVSLFVFSQFLFFV